MLRMSNAPHIDTPDKKHYVMLIIMVDVTLTKQTKNHMNRIAVRHKNSQSYVDT